MAELGTFLSRHYNYFAVAVLILIGIYGMFAKKNLVKKLMGMNIFQVGVILFFVSLAVKRGATVPIKLAEGVDGALRAADYLNPLPHALMLTAIVVGVSTTGVALALLIKIYRHCGTLEERELIQQLKSDE